MDASMWTFETRTEFLIYLVHRDVGAYANHESDKAIGTSTCAINSQGDRCPAQRIASIAECYSASLRTPCKLNASTSNGTCRERHLFVNDTGKLQHQSIHLFHHRSFVLRECSLSFSVAAFPHLPHRVLLN